MKHVTVITLMLGLALMAACRAAVPSAPPPATPTTTPGAPTATAAQPTIEPTQTATPVETVSPTATLPPVPTVTEAAAAGGLSILSAPLDNRAIFAAGLVSGERIVLSLLATAPVYHIAITLDDTLTRVSGRQTVRYTNNEDIPLAEVYFHLHPNLLDGALTVADVTVDGAAAAAQTEQNQTALRVPLGRTLSPGDTAIIEMAFETRVPTDIGRNYGVLAYYADTLALAHFYPMLSVYDDEGWNIIPADVQGDITYSDTGFYLVDVTAPAEVVLVSGGVEIRRTEAGDSQTVRYAAGPARDYFLAASPNYTVVSRTVGETTINSYAPRDLQTGAELALEVAAAALTIHSSWLSPYPYTELDIVTTPTSALGIEYPGIIVGTLNMYNLEGMTMNGTPLSTFVETTTAHEVGHQWFYNLVGNDQLDEPWLDEALVQYITYRYFLEQQDTSGGEAFFQSLAGRWANIENADIPIGLPVAAYEGWEYGAIVYGRGALFVNELAETLGVAVFDEFLRDYTDRNRWGIGTAAGFQEMAEAACECDLGPLWAEWVTPADTKP